MYRVAHKLPQIYTANHATFPIQIHKITVQISCNFWGTQYIKKKENQFGLVFSWRSNPRLHVCFCLFVFMSAYMVVVFYMYVCFFWQITPLLWTGCVFIGKKLFILIEIDIFWQLIVNRMRHGNF